jgi:hypothetical protein
VKTLLGTPTRRALAAVALAAAGEACVRTSAAPRLGYLLLLGGGILLSFGAWPRPMAGPAPEVPRRSRQRVVAAVVALAAALSGALAVFRILDRDFASPQAVRLWLLSLVGLLVAGVLGDGCLAFPPRWGITRLPAEPSRRRFVLAALAAILLIGAVSRFAGLSVTPGGINADEGDRAAVAIDRLRSDSPPTIFGRGWYHISNIYFALLAAFMKVFGVDFAGARTLGAASGVIALAVLVWLGVRHFGWVAGLSAGAFYATWGAGLMFARETTEAGPTALLWTISAALLLEAGRRGGLLPWIGAALAGGFSIYFYPPGRIWPVFFACVVVGFLVGGPAGARRRIAGGAAAGFAACLVIVTPFIAAMKREPGEFTIRARETTIFRRKNLERLNYYRPEWSTPRVLAEQLERAVGLFDRYPDANFFWPVDRPAATAGLSALALLGLVAAAGRLRDPRLILVVVWFAAGFSGVLFTVETPALQRLSCAVSAVPLLAGLSAGEIRRRFATEEGRPSANDRRPVATAVTALFVAGVVIYEGALFFGKEGGRDYWPYPTAEGRAVAAQGRDTWVFSLGDMFHMVNSGWVRLLATETPRAGVLTPGSFLPAPIPADRNLAFLAYPRQLFFLPFLAEIYPNGTLRTFTHLPDVFVVSVYRVPREAWQARQGALLRLPGGEERRVSAIGDVPAGAPAGVFRWTARLRVTRFWNYLFVVGPGPARLVVNGREILRAEAGARERSAVVSLPRGDHSVALEMTLKAPGVHPLFLLGEADPAAAPETWRAGASPAPAERLRAEGGPAAGLLGRIEIPGRPAILRLDGAIASGGFTEEMDDGESFDGVWTGSLRVSEAGRHAFKFYTHGGMVELTVGNAPLVRTEGTAEQITVSEIDLAPGLYPVRLTFHAAHRPGALEWAWKPPAGVESIVPPSVLVPPDGAGLGPPLGAAELGTRALQPLDRGLYFTP